MNDLNLYNNYFKITFWLIIIIEILSFLGHNFNLVNQILFVLIILATFIISLWKLEYGFWIVCTELFIGSFGYLFFYDVGDFRFSIRLGLFLAVIIAWLIQLIKNKKVTFKQTNIFWPFIIFLFFIIIGVVNGWLNGNPLRDVFFDFNAYLYFGLIFVIYTIINSWNKIIHFLQILLAAIITIAIKTVFLLFYFTHQPNENLFRLMYTWIRDTRVGEIAPVVENYYRVFFQSHIWSLFAMIIIFLLLILIDRKVWSKRNYLLLWLGMILSSLTLIISFSRSFWLALAFSFLLIFIYLFIKEKISWKKIVKISIIIIIVIILELSFITGLVNIKLPGQSGAGLSAASLVKERITTTEEAAIGSRFSLLKPLVNKSLEKPLFGSGFGTTVTYQTEDPRTKEKNGGWYTSYAFEWGYLDIIVKIGFIGLFIYLLFIWKIIKQGLISLKQDIRRLEYVLVIGFLFSLITLLIIHFTTPYINHPLGIHLIISCSAIFSVIYKSGKDAKNLPS